MEDFFGSFSLEKKEETNRTPENPRQNSNQNLRASQPKSTHCKDPALTWGVLHEAFLPLLYPPAPLTTSYDPMLQQTASSGGLHKIR